MVNATEKRQEIAIVCNCGRVIELKLVGGQYQDSWQGDCECGCKWNLDEISERLAEIQDYPLNLNKTTSPSL